MNRFRLSRRTVDVAARMSAPVDNSLVAVGCGTGDLLERGSDASGAFEGTGDLLTADLAELFDVRHEYPPIPMSGEPEVVVNGHLPRTAESLGFIRRRSQP